MRKYVRVYCSVRLEVFACSGMKTYDDVSWAKLELSEAITEDGEGSAIVLVF